VKNEQLNAGFDEIDIAQNIPKIISGLHILFINHYWFKDFDSSNWLHFDQHQQEKLAALVVHYQEDLFNIKNNKFVQIDISKDRRFNDDKWQQTYFKKLAAIYLILSDLMREIIAILNIHPKKAQLRLNFLVDQFLAANAPSNYLFSNPEALNKAYQTNGISLLNGFNNFAADVCELKLRHCLKSSFQIGKNLACTKGEVVFKNDLLELIQYYPTTTHQYHRPVFIVPPMINKYYILDLQPHNSLIKHLIDQGFMVFVISWKNFSNQDANLAIDDFIQDGVITALRTVRAISEVKEVNCVGFCIGGTLLSCALAILAARGDESINSLTLLTTMLDFSDTGILDIFIDNDFVNLCDAIFSGKSNLPAQLFRGEIMVNTFSLLRPNELWWNYHTLKYLQGEHPKPLDLLFWNNDSTNLPGNFFCWYLHHTYLNNNLKDGKLQACKQIINFSNIKTDAYLFASKQDHIVPWCSSYQTIKLLGGKCQFVLGASGHIAGVINPPRANKRKFWLNDELNDDPSKWLENADEYHGSWWYNWFKWLEKRSGNKIKSRAIGSPEYPVLEAAPGSYVFS